MSRSAVVRCAASIVVLLAVGVHRVHGQARPMSPSSQWKGVFEPVSFTEDIDFLQAVFVNADVGWVAGKHGTIIHTTNGGKTWEAQLGGDPADRADDISVLHFLDERRGWAIQGRKTLHTRDGESWEEIGSAPYAVSSVAFVSPRVGFLAGSEHLTQSGPTTIFRTTDGGRNWKPVWDCAVKMAMGGLAQSFRCEIDQIHFPSPQVGYAVAGRACSGCGGPSLLAKTTDGGTTWKVMTGPGVLEEDRVTGLFFLDANTGFVRLGSKKLHVTTDGGATWRGIVASPGADIQFADPSVGWAIDLGWIDPTWTYTTDGGKRWTSRQLRMPATTRAFSFPRRDRAYVAGDHGMIYRYRVVPAAEPMVANALEAPAMPGFDSPVDEQVAQLEQVVKDINTELGAAAAQPRQAGAGAGAAGSVSADSLAAFAAQDSAIAFTEPFEAPLPPASGFTASCCKKSFNRLEVLLGALSQTLPDFIGRYRNLNLLLAALRMSNELPDEFRSMKGGLRTFRRAQDKESAQAALASVIQAVAALKQTTAVSMQQQLPPVPSSGSDAGGGTTTFLPASNDVSAPAAAPTPPTPQRKDSTKNAVKDAAKDAAGKAVKKGLGGLLKKP